MILRKILRQELDALTVLGQMVNASQVSRASGNLSEESPHCDGTG
jgi:hypothetical protein